MSELNENGVTDLGSAPAAESQILTLEHLKNFRDSLQGLTEAVQQQIDAIEKAQQNDMDLPSFLIVIATNRGGGTPDTFDGTGTPPTFNVLDEVRAIDAASAQTIGANRYRNLDVHAVTQLELDVANAAIKKLASDAKKKAALEAAKVE
jgi:hypothetical protein